jgi:hypothetical protein
MLNGGRNKSNEKIKKTGIFAGLNLLSFMIAVFFFDRFSYAFYTFSGIFFPCINVVLSTLFCATGKT